MAGDDADPEALYDQFRQAQDGDTEALELLLRGLRPLLLHEIRPRVRSSTATEAVAEELTQDALVRVAKGLSGCRAQTETQLRAWCRTIARRRVIDWYRRRSAERERKTPGALADVLWSRAESGRPQPEGELTHSEMQEVEEVLGSLLLEAQAKLSEGTQEVLRRRLLYHDIWRAAGEAAGTTPGGAKRRYQRATDRLRKEVLRRIRNLPDAELRKALLQRTGVDHR